ncbi:hypothetical protein GCWU000246_00232 [Jonquetella anthropi E3_33 E1]|nr:hypothetical protein GCWU000246_00232 [Jonquetella anthropi E3_33 E1]
MGNISFDYIVSPSRSTAHPLPVRANVFRSLRSYEGNKASPRFASSGNNFSTSALTKTIKRR